MEFKEPLLVSNYPLVSGLFGLHMETAVLFDSKPMVLLFEVQTGSIINLKCIAYQAGLNLTESQLSPPTMKILNKIPSIK